MPLVSEPTEKLMKSIFFSYKYERENKERPQSTIKHLRAPALKGLHLTKVSPEGDFNC